MSTTTTSADWPTDPRVIAYWTGCLRRGYSPIMPVYPTSVAEWRTRHQRRGYTGDTRMHAIWARGPAIGDKSRLAVRRAVGATLDDLTGKDA